jgi:hypothetical protein
VTISNLGATTSSAAQTIKGTVDLADAGSTVRILDGTTQIGKTTAASDGSWSADVTLVNQGSNVLTATDTNAAGKGTSNSVTFMLQSSPSTPSDPPAAVPTLKVADSTLSVQGGGGRVDLGINVTGPTSTTVTITGLPRYETITDKLDHRTFRGSSITLTAAEVNSGLRLTSNYQGTRDPTATLTVTATSTTGSGKVTSAPVTITVTDPPPSTSSSGHSGHAFTSSGAAALLDQNGGHFSGNSPFGGDHTSSGPDIGEGLKSSSNFHG